MITQQDILNAVDNNEIYFVYQPILDLKTEKIVHFEALARWAKASPVILFALIEGYELTQVSNYLIDLAIKARHFLNKPIHVNLNYCDLHYIKQIDKSICVEITESCLSDPLIPKIKKLCDANYIYLDDAFADYSAIKWIPQIAFAGVKLDKFLFDQLETEYKEKYIDFLRGVRISLTGIPITCEGIEHQYQADICKDIGFEYAQGYYFYKPQSIKYWLETL